MNNKQLYKISKYVYNETFLSYTLNMSGSNVEEIQRKMQKNPKYIRNQTMTMRIVFGIYLFALVIIPYQLFKALSNLSIQNVVSNEWLIFCSGLFIAIYCAIQWVFLFMLGMFQGSSILEGGQFKWLATLPFDDKDLQKISLFTFFRSMDTSVIGLIFTLPLGIFFGTNNIGLALVGLVLSILNSLFGYSVLVILSEKMSRVISTNQGNNRRNNIIRIIWLGSYIIVIMLIGIGINAVSTQIFSLIETPTMDVDSTVSWIKILAWIPLGLSQGILLGSLYIDSVSVSMGLYASLISLGIFALIAWNLAKKSLKKLSNVIYPEESKGETTVELTTISDISIDMRTPPEAFYKKDRNMATRDMQFLMFILMSLLFPSAALLFPLIGGDEFGAETVYSTVCIYIFMGSAFLTIGSMGIDQSGVTITASLPIIVREQVKAKLKWPFRLVPLSIIPPLIYFANTSQFAEALAILGITVIMSLILSVALIELKALMFGKMKYKYILEEYRTKNKVLKWIGIGIFGFFLYILTFVPLLVLSEQGEIAKIWYIFLPIELVLSAVLYGIFNYMFPKPHKG